MSTAIHATDAAKLLLQHDDILILTHKNPDGDTLGSGFALWRALCLCGKRARVENERPFPARYSYLFGQHNREAQDFDPAFVVAVDVADPALLGSLTTKADRVDLAVDHHGTHKEYAQHLFCEPHSASCCELVAEVIDAMGVVYDSYIADALYSGVNTDTGCFRYSNTTPRAMRLAARLIEQGARAGELNRLFYETKSRERFALELAAMQSMRFFEDGRVAVLAITQAMLRETGCSGEDVEGISTLPRTIEGVEVGVTLRETLRGTVKVSLRTNEVDASAVCASLGGGGHVRAAGCELETDVDGAIDQVLHALQGVL